MDVLAPVDVLALVDVLGGGPAAAATVQACMLRVMLSSTSFKEGLGGGGGGVCRGGCCAFGGGGGGGVVTTCWRVVAMAHSSMVRKMPSPKGDPGARVICEGGGCTSMGGDVHLSMCVCVARAFQTRGSLSGEICTTRPTSPTHLDALGDGPPV